MAKAYSASVKLPNLVSVPHPLTKLLPKSGLNVEGRNSRTDSSVHSRKSYITALLGNELSYIIKTEKCSCY